MRTLAIGDIHGFLDAFDALLAVVGPQPDDRIITLGDYVDRGPDSAGVLDRLLEWHATGILIPLRGNHDEMMLASRRDKSPRRLWLRYGGVQTLESYGHSATAEEYDRVPESHYRFIEHTCRDWYETDTHLFAHANIHPEVPMDKQDKSVLLWERIPGPIAHYSGKKFICGHSRQESGLPLNLKTAVCIDTGIYEPEGWLTCLHVETGVFWQSDVYGQTRMGRL